MAATVSYKFHSPGVQNAVLTLELYRNGEAWGDELPFGNPHFRFGKVKAQVILGVWDVIEDYVGPNTGSGRYSLGTDTKCGDKVRIWYQVDLVTA